MWFIWVRRKLLKIFGNLKLTNLQKWKPNICRECHRMPQTPWFPGKFSGLEKVKAKVHWDVSNTHPLKTTWTTEIRTIDPHHFVRTADLVGKIWSSNWIISPRIGMKIPKDIQNHPTSDDFLETLKLFHFAWKKTPIIFSQMVVCLMVMHPMVETVKKSPFTQTQVPANWFLYRVSIHHPLAGQRTAAQLEGAFCTRDPFKWLIIIPNWVAFFDPLYKIK